ncbi:iron complex transport system substrate-binding protein [Rhodopseudomonas julia]|uniref:Iron complex transport system substrate-binding protein n=1 Tax=Rhodopseudomonas julia TaxID=200617 RepID=A0ABU0C3R6_9BRAD|nr:ABC transporter substrate-binding protein [Rhodopseudomonas julia]MDQ0324887.1 iron complex transport system substrate-binding protein [Rhodopseudomonas julia]
MCAYPPERIVCLTEETVETLRLLGEDWRIVGVPQPTGRSGDLTADRTVVSGFTQADIPAILALQPDLVLTFCDIQNIIASELIWAGVPVHAFNQRNVAGILAMIRMLGAMVDAAAKADRLARSYAARIEQVRNRTSLQQRPRVYFEAWNNPLMSGAGWISDLIEIAGGQDVFAHLRAKPGAADHILTPPQILEAAPEVILASWCGKPVDLDEIRRRQGWGALAAVRDNRLTQIDASLIHQPGPLALTKGLDAIVAALHEREEIAHDVVN